MISFILANMILPVMVTKAMHVTVGSAIIGLFEGIIIAKLLGLHLWRSVGAMVLANYITSLTGMLLFSIGERRGLLVTLLFEKPLYHTTTIVWISVAALALATLLIEWPIVVRLLQQRLQRPHQQWLHALGSVAVANLITYSCISPYYWMQSRQTIGRDVEVVPLNAIVQKSHGTWVYFVNTDGKGLSRVLLDGRNRRHVSSIDLSDAIARLNQRNPLLYVALLNESKEEIDAESETSAAHYEIRAYRRGADDGETIARVNSNQVRRAHVVAWGEREPMHPADASTLMFGIPAVTDWRGLGERQWGVWPRFYGGLEVDGDEQSRNYSVTFMTPFDAWIVRNVTVLPGNLVVFEFAGQICVLEIESARLALLTRGFGPVVVIDET